MVPGLHFSEKKNCFGWDSVLHGHAYEAKETLSTNMRHSGRRGSIFGFFLSSQFTFYAWYEEFSCKENREGLDALTGIEEEGVSAESGIPQ